MESHENIPTQKTKGQETDPSIAEAIATLQEFRQNLYNLFPYRADALMDLVDALASNTNAHSVVELSLSPLFRREYSSVYDAIEHLFVPSKPENTTQEQREHEQGLLRLIAPFLPAPQQRKYWLFGTDVTYLPRQFARTLAERTFVHCPNTIAGNKPVTIGHDYSILSYLPEKASTGSPPWVVPLIVRRVESSEKASQVGAEQIRAIVTDKTLPFKDALCVLVEDSAYSGRKHLATVAILPNTVSIIRFPGNRVVYRKFELPEGEENTVGHPIWYGERFDLKDPDTWPNPDETAVATLITKKGQTYTVQLEGWHNMVRTGKKAIPMHEYPFTLVRARVLDADGNSVFKRDMWLITIGERRQELSLVDIWEAYGQRYDVEHFYRYGKQRLLMAAYQTPDVEREENWWQIVQLAYIQLWLARSLAEALPNPWERYLPLPEPGEASPSNVQRDFERIIRQIGTPAQPPKRRGNSPGRTKGDKPPPRARHPVIKKA
jgi:hypothetical protein